MNGDYFQTMRQGDALPMGAVVIDERPYFIPQGLSRVVAIGPDGIMRKTKVRSNGVATTANGYAVPIGAINDPMADAHTTVAFTSDWGRDVPTGRRAVVINGTTVTKVLSPGRPRKVPAGGVVLWLSNDEAGDVFIRGSAVDINLDVIARDGGKVVSASGHGGTFLADGEITSVCSDYENSLRPRTMLAWNERGDVWFITASTRVDDPPDGIRVGGATKTQVAQIARSLGATWAVTMDGGGSTSLYARIARKERRIDLPRSAWARPVPVVWTISAIR